MPRLKPGTIATQKQAMYTPTGSEIEKCLPKNFRPRAYEEPSRKEETIILTKTRS